MGWSDVAPKDKSVMKSKEEILLGKFPLLPKSSNKEGMERIIAAMEEYGQQCAEQMSIISNARTIVEMKSAIASVRKENPYPVTIFSEPDDKDWSTVGLFLKQHGYSPDRIFGKWGRVVWDNCIHRMESYFNEENSLCDGA